MVVLRGLAVRARKLRPYERTWTLDDSEGAEQTSYPSDGPAAARVPLPQIAWISPIDSPIPAEGAEGGGGGGDFMLDQAEQPALENQAKLEEKTSS